MFSGVCQTTICHLPVSFAEPSSYSKPDQPSNPLCQEKRPVRYKSVTHTPISLFQDRTNTHGVQGRVKQVECSQRDCLVSSQKNGHNGEMVSAPLPAASRACHSTVVRAEMPTNSLHLRMKSSSSALCSCRKRQVYPNIAIGSNILARVTVEPVSVFFLS
ncbi:uncharacterized protein IAS62_004728 [Cryptococcus decagattii]|uniref:Uncharacterized protein n=1 Tax=Cryptococcus decagattii TaxID=1859122 RepID=A0ABZ2AXV6_9TREE